MPYIVLYITGHNYPTMRVFGPFNNGDKAVEWMNDKGEELKKNDPDGAFHFLPVEPVSPIT